LLPEKPEKLQREQARSYLQLLLREADLDLRR